MMGSNSPPLPTPKPEIPVPQPDDVRDAQHARADILRRQQRGTGGSPTGHLLADQETRESDPDVYRPRLRTY